MLIDENWAIQSLLSRSSKKSDGTNLWYLDNGASNHMTGFREKFTMLDENVTGSVHFEDGSTVKIE